MLLSRVTLVAAPVWAVAHAYAEGEGFAPQQANYGYGAMIGVLMRPVAIVFGFVFSFFIINIAMWFASLGLGIFLSGMLNNVVMGPISMIATLAVIISTIFMVLRYVLRMVTHLPENIPNWMGGRSNNAGEMQAAESGNAAAQSGGKTAMRGMATVNVGRAQKDQQAIDGAAKNQQAAAEKAEGRAYNEQRDEKNNKALADSIAQMNKNNNPGGGGEKGGEVKP